MHQFLPAPVQVSFRSCTPAVTKTLEFGPSFRPHLMFYSQEPGQAGSSSCKALGKPLHSGGLNSLPTVLRPAFLQDTALSFWPAVHLSPAAPLPSQVCLLLMAVGHGPGFDEEGLPRGRGSPLIRDIPGLQSEGSKTALHSSFSQSCSNTAHPPSLHLVPFVCHNSPYPISPSFILLFLYLLFPPLPLSHAFSDLSPITLSAWAGKHAS